MKQLILILALAGTLAACGAAVYTPIGGASVGVGPTRPPPPNYLVR